MDRFRKRGDGLFVPSAPAILKSGKCDLLGFGGFLGGGPQGYTVRFKIWAGGGGAYWGGYSGYAGWSLPWGGGSAYVDATLKFATATTLTLRVGPGGLRGSSYAGVGVTGIGGAGYSGVFLGSTPLIVVGSGGGALCGNGGGGHGGITQGGDGTDGDGISRSKHGKGATQTAGGSGAPSCAPGGYLMGGQNVNQAAGGAGYYGGGAAAVGGYPDNAGNGGGGSSFIDSSATNVFALNGSNRNTGNADDPDLEGFAAGLGGLSTGAEGIYPGNHGRIIAYVNGVKYVIKFTGSDVSFNLASPVNV